MKNRYLTTVLMVLFSCLGLLAARAAPAEDEPAPGVARVSLIHGDVSTQRGDSGDWVATTINAPVVRGDRVSTGDRSRTEIELDYANVLRLGQRAEVKIADLGRTRIQVQVAQGLVSLTVLKGTEADVEIDTPNMAVRPLGEGTYRVQVNSASQTEVTVRKGEAEVSTPQGNTTVEKGQLITIEGTDNPQYQVLKARARDEWDQWNRERDSVISDARSYTYANRYYTGAHDLDGSGHWVQVPDYDWCWTPYINAGWVPYRYGRWAWEPYWGWTWVSNEPWGWAPYHYGRWISYGDSWCWWPGYSSYGAYPIWAPAYVSFIGFGFGGRHWGFGFGFGFDSIGWCPLGPYDPYYPWSGYHNTYNVVNITNITNVTNVTNVHVRNTGNQPYRTNVQNALNNARVRGAITTASADDFVRGRVPRNQRPVDANTLRQAQLVQGTVPAVPTRDSLRPGDRPVRNSAIPTRAASADNFFTRRTPPAAAQPSFAEHAARIQQMVEHHNPLEAANRAPAASANAGFRGNASSANGTPGSEAAPRYRLDPATRPDAGKFGHRWGTAPTTMPSGQGAQGSTKAEAGQNAPPAAEKRTDRQTVQPVEQPERPGWQRFGTGRPRDRWPASVNVPGESSGKADNRQTQRAPEAPSERPGWQRFGNPASSGRPAAAGEPLERENRAPRPAPDSASAGGGRHFSPQGRPAPGGRNFGSAAPRPENRSEERPGWNRFTPRPESAPSPRAERGERGEGWSNPAPRSEPRFPSRSEGPGFSGGSRGYERPPLEIRKPITTERAPRSFEGGGNRGGGWSGGGRGERGSGRSAPAQAPAPRQSEQRGRH